MGRSGQTGGDWKAELRARGYRLTPQRQLVLEAVGEIGHATPEEIASSVRRTASGLSISTVYRTLELLEDLGLVRHSHLGHGAPTYSLAAQDDHVHLVCRAARGCRRSRLSSSGTWWPGWPPMWASPSMSVIPRFSDAAVSATPRFPREKNGFRRAGTAHGSPKSFRKVTLSRGLVRHDAPGRGQSTRRYPPRHWRTMRISTLARRSVATLAATALLTTGGAVLGLTTGVANAQTVSGVTRIGGGQAIGVNNGVNGFQIDGTDFMPSNQQTVTVAPHSPIAGQGNIAGVVRDNSAQCTKTLGTVRPDAHCDGPLLFDVNLGGAAAGVYDVFVTQTTRGKLTNTSETDFCTSCITVVSAGPATATSVAPTGTSNGPLTIKGTNFANGARVFFYNTDAQGNATTIDTLLHFGSISIPSTRRRSTAIYTADPGAGGTQDRPRLQRRRRPLARPGPAVRAAAGHWRLAWRPSAREPPTSRSPSAVPASPPAARSRGPTPR